METSKYFVKFPIKKMGEISKTDVVNLFHDWIREQDQDKVLLDVADYSHVPNGPGVMLIGFYEDLSFEINAAEPHFIVSHKRPLDGSAEEKLHHVFSKAAEQANKFQKAFPELVELDTENFKIGVNDRYLERDETLSSLSSIIESFASKTGLSLSTSNLENADDRYLPQVKVTSSASQNFEQLAATTLG